MTCEKSVRPVFTVMPPIRKIEEFTANPPRRVQIDTKQNPLQIVDNARLFRQTRGLNRTAVSPIPISMDAYFKMINAQGGVNGRKITWISYDDAYTPPKTVEMTRKLVEEDEVLFIAGSVGTPTNSAVWHYMNEKKVPQLFPSTGATKWDDPKGHPWTMAFFISYQAEGRISTQSTS